MIDTNKETHPEDITTWRKYVLEQAIEKTMGQRNKSYGDPVENHCNIAAIWNAYWSTRIKNGAKTGLFDAEDVMLMMALLKIARLAQRLGTPDDQFDSALDACAYIAMSEEARR